LKPWFIAHQPKAQVKSPTLAEKEATLIKEGTKTSSQLAEYKLRT
jgi:hypothetical protein